MVDREYRRPGQDDLGGDPVCWLDRVCPDCGLFLEDTDALDHADEPCPRCGRTDEPGNGECAADTEPDDPLPSPQ
jgi:rubrerythrin